MPVGCNLSKERYFFYMLSVFCIRKSLDGLSEQRSPWVERMQAHQFSGTQVSEGVRIAPMLPLETFVLTLLPVVHNFTQF